MSKETYKGEFDGKGTAAFLKFASHYNQHRYDEVFKHLINAMLHIGSLYHIFQKEYDEAIAIFEAPHLQQMIDHIIKESEGFNDVLGDIYMSIASRYHTASMAQFFTPKEVSRLMATIINLPEAGADDKPLRIGDIAGCGSGRNILAAAEKCGERRYKYYFEGTDLDTICARMAVLNCYLNCIPARIVHGDALELTTYNVYECCLNYTELEQGKAGYYPFIMQYSPEECKAYEQVVRSEFQKPILDGINTERVKRLDQKKEAIQGKKVAELRQVFAKLQNLVQDDSERDSPQTFEQQKTQKAAKKGENDTQNTLF
jgi:type I restriction-modification system DNA methylase subunit